MRIRAAVGLFMVQLISVLAAPALSAEPDVLTPLQIGNTWKYRLVATTEEGRILETREYTSEVVGKWMLKGKLIYGVKEDGYCFWMYHGKQGLRSALVGFDVEINGMILIDDSLLLKYPASAGESWQANAKDEPVTRMTLVSKDETVKVPAGTYKCHIYQATDQRGDPTLRYAVAPGVGIVRINASTAVFGENRIESIDLLSTKHGKQADHESEDRSEDEQPAKRE